jgi:hypothetical protein
MTLRDLFVLRGARATGVFIAPQSLAFALSTCIVVTATRAGRTLGCADPESTLVTLLAAVVVSAVIVAVTMSDRDVRPVTAGGWTAAALIAWVNVFILYVAALGIEKF